uniref:Uncharacterized protein n=1 Tax=Arundo donax TaxID=35708 RepID=A0A0A9GSB4_ARUDO
MLEHCPFIHKVLQLYKGVIIAIMELVG